MLAILMIAVLIAVSGFAIALVATDHPRVSMTRPGTPQERAELRKSA